MPRLRLWFAGGEVLSSDLWQRFQARLPQSHLINLYGASEMSDDVTAYDAALLCRSAASVPIGRPIANMQTYVLDRHLQPVPIGVPGELYVGGDGLTRGYLNRPTLTAERFLPHPFSDVPGARLYKTGDLVRYLPDGSLEFLGRIDHQVKIRGIRIELGEIEVLLGQHPAVREAVVTMHAESSEEPRLVAYMVPSQTQTPTVPELTASSKKISPTPLYPQRSCGLQPYPEHPVGSQTVRRCQLLTVPVPYLTSLSWRHTPQANSRLPPSGLNSLVSNRWGATTISLNWAVILSWSPSSCPVSAGFSRSRCLSSVSLRTLPWQVLLARWRIERGAAAALRVHRCAHPT